MTTSNELLTSSWHTSQGTPRELLSIILSKRLDEVFVEGRDINQLRKFEQLGFPIEPVLAQHPGVSIGASNTEKLGRPQTPLDGRLQCMLRPYLSYSELPVRNYNFVVSSEDVRHYGEQSGDLNPLHFDDETARRHGFTGRISHGMIFNGWLTRLLGTEFPGPGTIYLRYICVYVAPIYPDTPYTVRVSTPHHDRSRGTYRILAQVFSSEGRHATIAYSDVLNRSAA